jgi:hypothetical protein
MIKYFQISFSNAALNFRALYLNIAMTNFLRELKLIDYTRINLIVTEGQNEQEIAGLDSKIVNINVKSPTEFGTLSELEFKEKVAQLCSDNLVSLFNRRHWNHEVLSRIKSDIIGRPDLYIANSWDVKKNDLGFNSKLYIQYCEDKMVLWAELRQMKREVKKLKILELKANPFWFDEFFQSYEWHPKNCLVTFDGDKKFSLRIDFDSESYSFDFDSTKMNQDEFFEYMSYIAFTPRS